MYKEITVKIDDLLLDPNNPRFSLYHEDLIPDEKFEEKQGETLEKMLESKAFSVDELIDSIKSKGFIPAGKIFVKKIGNKYLVIEGNRRVSAVKYLLQKHEEGSDKLDQEIINSFLKLQVNDTSDYSDIERRQLVSLIHLGGFKGWGPLPSSFSIYQEYMRELALERGKTKEEIEKFTKNPKNFVYVPAIARRIKDQFAITLPQVRNGVRVYRTHLQLMEISHNDEIVENENNYSMIGDTIKDPTLQEYFSYDVNTATFSDEGAEKFLDLCLTGNDQNDRVITAAASGESSLRDFRYVISSPSATPEDLTRIVEGRKDAGLVASTVRSREDSENLASALTQVLTLLEGVEIGMIEIGGGLSASEKRTIEKIEKRLKQIKLASGGK